MTCEHCCGADSIFDKKSAKRDLKRYRKKGPNETTLSLLNALKKEGVSGMCLLDIGGGIGVLQHELLKEGVTSSLDIDASSAYLEKAKELMQENETGDQMEFRQGDFLDEADAMDKFDIVTLERVVCCYPDAEVLIITSTGKAQRYYGIVYPADNLLSKLFSKLTHFYFFLKRNPFRTFIHSEKMIHELISAQGFERMHYDTVFPWKIALYKRKTQV